ncbi:hypothetical protein OPQ81_009928 [Rhizoctonia solani]|nr:hypothetical protein OPQ81_009928 [Rhizoctonia solani]
MSVASRNPFAVLNDDDVISTPAPAAAAPAPKAPAPQKKEQPQKGPSNRGGRYYQRGRGTQGTPRDEAGATQEGPTSTGDRPAEGRSDRGRGRARGRARGDGRGRGRDPRPDRHSQTGKVDTEKRVNSGWGADEGRTELAAEQSGAADATADAAGNEWAGQVSNDWGAPAEGATEAKPAEGEAQDERPKEEEEEDNTMTLSEYLAKKKTSDVVPPKLEARAANEGSDNTLWKDAVQLQRDEDEDNYFVGKTKAAPKARAKKEEKIHIDIDARFAPIERGGRGRGGERGRGDRGRGGRGRGGDSGRRRTETNIDVSDESAFPSLS